MCAFFLLEVRTGMRIVANYSIFIAVEYYFQKCFLLL